MSWSGHMRARLRLVRGRMRKNSRTGSAAIEFAVVAPAFFLLLFGILETGLIFFASTVLENATDAAARMVRTGQVQSQNMTAANFRTTICNQIAPLLACDGNLQIDVESYANFNNANFGSPIVNGALNPNLNGYSPGNAGDVVLVRAFYTWTVFTPLLQPFFANVSGGKHLISATAAFRNEPFT